MRTIWNVARLASAPLLLLGLAALIAPGQANAATLSSAPALSSADVDVVSIIMSVFGLIGDILRFAASIVNAVA